MCVNGIASESESERQLQVHSPPTVFVGCCFVLFFLVLWIPLGCVLLTVWSLPFYEDLT